MKKNIKIIVVLLSCFLGSQSFAQVSSAGRPSLSIGAELGIPTGSFNETHKLGLGGSLKALFPIFTGGAVTLSAGYMNFSGDRMGTSNINYNPTNLVPIKAGLRYNISGQLYLEPQLGYTSISYKGPATGNGGFTYAFNLGTMLQDIDLAIRYEEISTSGYTRPFVGVRAAYNFKL